MKKLEHGYVIVGRDEQGPFSLGSFDSKRIAIKRYQEAMASKDWVAEYRDTLYVAQLVEQRIEVPVEKA